MQWWCSARDVAWTWTWQPYPGVWLFLALLVVGYLRVRRAGGRGSAHGRGRAAAFIAGMLLLWVALDWPLGALGAGYLASAHMLQFLLIALAAPPLLLLGVPRDAVKGAAVPLARAMHPLFALLVFNAVVIATHLPVVTDTLMRSQLGSFAVDTLWLAAGLLYWWPVIVGAHERRGFSPPVQMGYLFVSMVFMTAPGVMITFSDLPIYGIYELAPPTGALSPIDDQRIAGVLMKIGAGTILWTAIAILFVRWKHEEDRLLARDMARIGTRGRDVITPEERNAIATTGRDAVQRTAGTAGE